MAYVLSLMVPLGHHEAMGAIVRAFERLTLTCSTYLQLHAVLLTLGGLIRSLVAISRLPWQFSYQDWCK